MSTNKLNEALGISNIDDFLSDLDVGDEVKDDISQLDSIDEQVKQNVDKIDGEIQKCQKGEIVTTSIADINSNLQELRELIGISKDTIKHVYEQITSVELCDSEAVQALGKLIEAAHVTVSEYINLYKDRLAFYDKVRFEAMKHRNDMEKIKYKHDLDMEKMNAKNGPAVDVKNLNNNAFSQEDVIKLIDSEKEN